MKTYVGTDGKLHFVNSAGADTVLPFSNSNIDYSNCYTDLAIFKGSQTAYHNIVITRELPKGKYIVSWSTFWTWYNNNGFHLSPVCGGFGSSYNPIISKLKGSTIVEYVDSGSAGQLGVVTIEENSDTITITQTANGYNTATAFFMKIE